MAKPIDKQRFYEVLARYLEVHAGGAAEPRQQYHGRVLVAEDNEDNRQLVERMLNRLGLDVISVASGDEAVRKTLSGSVQLVLMDRHMPEMDGVAATQLLRQAGFRRPIIAFTAGVQRETDALRDAGCDGVLDKPIDEHRLQSLLDRFLDSVPPGVGSADEDEDISRLVTQFLSGLGERRQRMNQALASRDSEVLESETHQIKGTAGAMGYPAMTHQAGIVEALLKVVDPQWSQVRGELAILDEMIEREQPQNQTGLGK